jgi:hypothetical protein
MFRLLPINGCGMNRSAEINLHINRSKRNNRWVVAAGGKVVKCGAHYPLGSLVLSRQPRGFVKLPRGGRVRQDSNCSFCVIVGFCSDDPPHRELRFLRDVPIVFQII